MLLITANDVTMRINKCLFLYEIDLEEFLFAMYGNVSVIYLPMSLLF